MPTPNTRAIIFDLGKVLIPFDFSIVYKAIEAACAHRSNEISKRIRDTGLGGSLETGRMESEAFVSAIARELDINLSFTQFQAIWNSIFLPDKLVPDEWLERLRTCGVFGRLPGRGMYLYRRSGRERSRRGSCGHAGYAVLVVRSIGAGPCPTRLAMGLNP